MRTVYHVITSDEKKFNNFSDKVNAQCIWRKPSEINKPFSVGEGVIFSVLDKEYDHVTIDDILAGKISKKKGK